MQEFYNEIIKKIEQERVLKDELMSRHTSFKIGGKADLFIKANSIDEVKLICTIAKQKKIPIYLIGNGTNILVSDKGIRGIVLKLNLNEVKVQDEFIYAEAGALLSKVANIACKNSLSGFEKLSGIPGTIGGAIKMNAGAYGQEMKALIYETTYLDENLELITIKNKEHEFSYRKSIFSNKKNYCIIATKLKLEKGMQEDIKKEMHDLFVSRKNKQPLEYANAGSTFKRGEEFITAELIDKAGLKGYNIGNAYVSEKHAGFIVNKGNATANDVLKLIEKVQQIVYEKFNKKIELEIEFIGEK
ncbi:MAG: UDP-N-acetylmuramate dehydrogenase [Clostridiales bacterium]|nr:UDP-N-acetylmuramate dehydrogenase [Clostridiales bacterium]